MRNIFLLLVGLNVILMTWQSMREAAITGTWTPAAEVPIPPDQVEPIYLLGEPNLAEAVAKLGEMNIPDQTSTLDLPTLAQTELAPSEAPQADQEIQLGVQHSQLANAKPKLYCASWGPFDSELWLEKIQTKLKNSGVVIKPRTERVNQLKGYWVYFPPFKRVSDTREYSKKLTEKGIDNYVLTMGENKGGLSLGFFKTKERADEYQQDLIAKGYNAIGDEYRKLTTEYWLDAQAEHALTLGRTWDQISSLQSGAQAQARECP